MESEVPEDLLQHYLFSDRVRVDAAALRSKDFGKSLRASRGTHEDFGNGELLSLQGTVPLHYQGHMYAIPVAVFLPHSYPDEPPTVLVKPGVGMEVKKPHVYVSSNGVCRSPYLSMWCSSSTLVELLESMLKIFTSNPPLVARPRDAAPAPQLPLRAQEPAVPVVAAAAATSSSVVAAASFFVTSSSSPAPAASVWGTAAAAVAADEPLPTTYGDADALERLRRKVDGLDDTAPGTAVLPQPTLNTASPVTTTFSTADAFTPAAQRQQLPECVICLENPAGIILLPCGHVCTCSTCAVRVTERCPYCNQAFTDKRRLFVP